jgi:endonuclease G
MRFIPLAALLLVTLASIDPRAVAQTTGNENSVMGNPSNARPDPNSSADNFLIERRQFVMSYNNGTKNPNWVSWHLNAGWLGKEGRGVFHPDDDLPSDWYHVVPSDYSQTGFDRGHMCPSGDRTTSHADNDAVFVMSNIIPQSPDNNRKTWEHLESFCRQLAQEGNELYIICGPGGVGGTGSNGFRTTLNARQRITVPSVTWKVVLILPKGATGPGSVTRSTQTIAVIVPNQQGIDEDWKQYLHSVREVEHLTGYNFFSNVPQDVQDVIEVTVFGDGGATNDQ